MNPYLFTFAVTLLLSVTLVVTKRWHGRYSLDLAHGIQKLHTRPTPRIGGLAIVLGLVSAWAASTPDVQGVLGPMLLAGIPSFAFGLTEDLTKRVSVRTRLLATLSSGALAWAMTGVAMQNTGFAPFDWLLTVTPIAVLFTAFAVGGMANAVNIIDGFNGLASGVVAILMTAMGVIALNLGDDALATVSFVVAACALGFGVVNWPFGPIFLGDGGAYLLGFCVGWVAVLLPMRHPEVTAWTTLLVCAYPVLEVTFSVRRRHRRAGHHPGQPDKAHLHNFIHRRLVTQAHPRLNCTLQNGLTSPLVWILAALPAVAAVAAVALATQPQWSAVAFGLCIFGYGAMYARLTQFRWCFSAVTLEQPATTTAATGV